MDDGRWYLANIIFLLGSPVREVPGSIVVSSHDNDWVFATNSNLIPEWLAMTGFSVSCRELLLCLTLSGNGVEIVRGGDAWLLGSVRILEHRGGHWSNSMKSFSARSSRTLNPLSCDCGRHIDCDWPFFFECSGVILSLDVRLWCCMLIYILQGVIYIL